MTIIRESIKRDSTGSRPTFHKITEDVKRVIEKSGVRMGICVISTHHTTCSVMTQEDSIDMTYTGLDYLQQDLTDIFEQIIPTCRKEGQYMHPGPKNTVFSGEHGEDKPGTLNTDAHLRSAFIGRSVTLQIMDGKADLGEFGHVYFIDFDQTRPRTRQIDIMVMGE